MANNDAFLQNQKAPYLTFEATDPAGVDNPDAGTFRMLFDSTDSNRLKYLDSAGTPVDVTSAADLSAHTGDPDAHNSALNDLTDVDVAKSKTPADNDVLTWDGAHWNAETPATVPTVASDLTDIDTDKSKTPADGDVLTFDGTHWNAEAAAGGASILDDLTDVDTDKSKTPADGDVLTFDGTHWNAEAGGGGGGGALNDLSDVSAASPTEGDGIRYTAGGWVDSGVVHVGLPTWTGAGVTFGTPSNMNNYVANTVGGAAGHWLQADFGSPVRLAVFEAIHHAGNKWVDMKIQASNDLVNWEVVYNVPSGLAAMTPSDWSWYKHDFTDKSVSARYWRIIKTSATFGEMLAGRFYDSQAGSPTWEIHINNEEAIVGPTVNDDGGDGYAVGSRWTVAASGNEWTCSDASAGAAVWNQTTVGTGTAFPSGPITGERFRRSDLEYMVFFYDGTRWVSETLHTAPIDLWGEGTTVTQILARPFKGLDALLESVAVFTFVATTNDGSNYWTLTIDKMDTSNAATNVLTQATSGDTVNTWTDHDNDAVDDVLAHAGDNDRFWYVRCTPTGTPGGFYAAGTVHYRLIAT